MIAIFFLSVTWEGGGAKHFFNIDNMTLYGDNKVYCHNNQYQKQKIMIY